MLKLWLSAISRWETQTELSLQIASLVVLLPCMSWHQLADEALLKHAHQSSLDLFRYWYMAGRPHQFLARLWTNERVKMFPWLVTRKVWRHVQSVAENALTFTLTIIGPQTRKEQERDYVAWHPCSTGEIGKRQPFPKRAFKAHLLHHTLLAVIHGCVYGISVHLLVEGVNIFLLHVLRLFTIVSTFNRLGSYYRPFSRNGYHVELLRSWAGRKKVK